MSLSSAREYWDCVAGQVKNYDLKWFLKGMVGGETWLSHYGQTKTQEQILRMLPQRNYRRILEVGCGIGQLTTLLASTLGCHATGIDVSPKMVDLAKQRSALLGIHKTDYHVMDAAKIGFDDALFDLVTSITVLQHISEYGQWSSAISEIVRITKPGGLILIYEAIPRVIIKKQSDLNYFRSRAKYLEEFNSNHAKLVKEKIIHSIFSAALLGLTQRLYNSHAKLRGRNLNFYESYKPMSLLLPSLIVLGVVSAIEIFPLGKNLLGLTRILIFEKSRL